MKIQLKSTSILPVLIMMASFTLAACTNSGKENKDPQADVAENTLPDKLQSSSADVTFLDEAGKAISLSSLKGKVVFINFWATWCQPCIHEMPSINELRKSFKGNDNIVFLMIDVDGNMKKSTAFMEKNKYDLPVYVPTGNIPSDFLRGAIPTTVIINKKGEIVSRVEGTNDYSSPEVLKAMNELIAKD